MERGREGGPRPIASLIEIGRALEEAARAVSEHAKRPALEEPDPKSIGAREVRAVLGLRALRREYLGESLSESGWAMMLELYAAHLEGRLVYQTQLGMLASVPPTTALATVRRLLDRGTFLSFPHPDDKRRLVIALADETIERLARYVAAAYRIAPILA